MGRGMFHFIFVKKKVVCLQTFDFLADLYRM